MLLSLRRHRAILLGSVVPLTFGVALTLALAPSGGADGAADRDRRRGGGLAGRRAVRCRDARASCQRVPLSLRVLIPAGAAAALAALRRAPAARRATRSSIVALATVVYFGVLAALGQIPRELRDALRERLGRWLSDRARCAGRAPPRVRRRATATAASRTSTSTTAAALRAGPSSWSTAPPTSALLPGEYYVLPTPATAGARCARGALQARLPAPPAATGAWSRSAPGYGVFARLASGAGYDFTGIEMDARCCEHLRSEVGRRGGPQRRARRGARPSCRRADAIALWHVMEHLPDPWAAWTRPRRNLEPGGMLVVRDAQPRLLPVPPARRALAPRRRAAAPVPDPRAGAGRARAGGRLELVASSTARRPRRPYTGTVRLAARC